MRPAKHLRTVYLLSLHAFRRTISQGYNLAYRPERDADAPSGLNWNAVSSDSIPGR